MIKKFERKRMTIRRIVNTCVVLSSIFISIIVAPLFSDAEYTKTITENGKLPATPADAVDSKVDVRDAFTFAGEFASDVLGGNAYLANHSYLSAERPNVVVLYDGVNNNQRSYVWYSAKLNLNADFEFEAYVFLSDMNTVLSNGVPDGMTFTLQNDPAVTEAIGGAGGGLGVYPRSRNTVNMIYNSVSVELDTFSNSASTDITNYDKQIANNYAVSWPHAAIGSTYVKDFKGYTPNANAYSNINQAYDNFTHLVPTVPSNATEGNKWFKGWKKLNVKWHPLEDGVNGQLSYTFEDYSTKTVTLDIDKYFNYTNSSGWDRKVTWGFTGSNGQKGNSFGVLITKLPQEPELNVVRKVRNVTKGETEFKTSTVADIGDVVEYSVNVENKVLSEIDLPLKKMNVSENLQTNSYVKDSFVYNNSLENSAVTQPKVSVDQDNNVTFSDDIYTYEPGESFNYSYKVTIANNTNEFTNDMSISSAYSVEHSYGETSVYVNPKNLGITKSIDKENCIVGDTVAYKIKTSVSNGKFLPTNISDVIAQGMEVVPDSTYVYYENDSASKTKLNDEAIWNDQQLSITDSALPTTVNENGVTSGKNLIVEYQVKIKNSLKGETVVSNKTKIEGQNKFKYNEHKQTYQAESNSVTLKVKTDVIINFKDIEDNLLNPSFITSKNSSFNQKNPIVIYLDTGDSYDYTSVLKEISDNLLKNENLVEISSQGNRTSTSIPKEGEQITLTYTSVATVTVEFVNEANQVMPGYTMILDTQVGDTLDLTTEPKVQTQLTNLMNAGYEIVKRPTNESALKVQQVATTVQYQIQGVLSLTSVPSTLDFGTLSYDATKKRVEDPSYDEQLVVTDTRADASNGWRLTASLSTPMTNSSGQELRNALRYMTKGKETILTKDSQVVYTNNKGTAGSYDVSDSWGTTDNTDGIKLQIESSDTVYTGDYVGVITWVVMAGQP